MCTTYHSCNPPTFNDMQFTLRICRCCDAPVLSPRQNPFHGDAAVVGHGQGHVGAESAFVGPGKPQIGRKSAGCRQGAGCRWPAGHSAYTGDAACRAMVLVRAIVCGTIGLNLSPGVIGCSLHGRLAVGCTLMCTGNPLWRVRRLKGCTGCSALVLPPASALCTH